MPEMRPNAKEIINKIDNYSGWVIGREFDDRHKGVELDKVLWDSTHPKDEDKLIIKYFLNNKKLKRNFIKAMKMSEGVEEKWIRREVEMNPEDRLGPPFFEGAYLRIKPLKDRNYLITVEFIFDPSPHVHLNPEFSYVTDYKGLMDFFNHVFIKKSGIKKALEMIEKYKNTELKKEIETQPWGLKLPELVNKRAKRSAQRKVEYLLRKRKIAPDFKRKLQKVGISSEKLEDVTVYVRRTMEEAKELKYEYIITLDFTYHHDSTIKHFVYSYLATREDLLHFVRYS